MDIKFVDDLEAPFIKRCLRVPMRQLSEWQALCEPTLLHLLTAGLGTGRPYRLAVGSGRS